MPSFGYIILNIIGPLSTAGASIVREGSLHLDSLNCRGLEAEKKWYERPDLNPLEAEFELASTYREMTRRWRMLFGWCR